VDFRHRQWRCFTIEHLTQFTELWTKLLDVHLDEGVENTISSKLVANGQSWGKSAYEVQFPGPTTFIMHKTVVESLGSTQNEMLHFAPNTISDLDRQLPSEVGLAKLWLVSPLQAYDGIGVPSICEFPLHSPSLKLQKSLDGHPNIQPTL
jgi:hypothetical protein